MNPIDWLLHSDSDPAIRWQVLRDLTDASPAAIAAERARIPREGLGAAILSCQQPDGSWRCPDTPTWLSTLFTSLLLRSTGADFCDPSIAYAVARPEANLRWSNQPNWDLRPAQGGGNPFFEGEVEPCINGGVLALGAYFGRPNENLARRLLSERLADGGWNCEAPKSQRSSFHTTICVLEGLLEYERAISRVSGGSAAHTAEIAAARHRAEEYFLERALFRRRSTGQLAHPEFLELAFPPRYHYDVLRALDYFRNAAMNSNGEHGASHRRAPDPRLHDAIHFLKTKQQPDGRWLLDRSYDEALAVPFTESPGQPSRWNTLRALRVLRWHDRQN